MADSKKHRRISPRTRLFFGVFGMLLLVLGLTIANRSGFLAAINQVPIQSTNGALSYEPSTFTVNQGETITLAVKLAVSGPINLTSAQLVLVYSTSRLQLVQATPSSSWQTASLSSSSSGSKWSLAPAGASSVAIQSSTSFGNLAFKGLEAGSATVTFDSANSLVLGQVDQESPAPLLLTVASSTGSVTATSSTSQPTPTTTTNPSTTESPTTSSSGSTGQPTSGSSSPSSPTTSSSASPNNGSTSSSGSLTILPGYTIGLTASAPPLVSTNSAIFYFLFLEPTKVKIFYGPDKTMSQSVESSQAKLAFSLKLANLAENTTYYYRVQLSNSTQTSQQLGQLKTFSSLVPSSSTTIVSSQSKVSIVMPDDRPGTAEISVVPKDTQGQVVTKQSLHIHLDQPDLASVSPVIETDGIYQSTITVVNPQSQTISFSILDADNQPVAGRQTIVFNARQSSVLVRLSLNSLNSNPLVRNSFIAGVVALLVLGWLFWRLSRVK
jgi:hypothetical protein